MLKQLLSVVAELALGLALAGLVLALVIPLLLKSGIISTGDRLGSVLDRAAPEEPLHGLLDGLLGGEVGEEALGARRSVRPGGGDPSRGGSLEHLSPGQRVPAHDQMMPRFTAESKDHGSRR